MKRMLLALAMAPIALLTCFALLVSCILAPDMARQACVYGEGSKQGEKVYTTGSQTGSGPQSGAGLAAGSNIHEGLTAAEARAWFDGAAGPGNVCQSYPEGQCTWWACMRAYKLGWKGVGGYWGNGGDWANSGRMAGYATTTTEPVDGAIISFPPGVQGADGFYGHVGIVEHVDGGSVLISEMNALLGLGVMNTRVIPAVSGAVYVLPDDKITGNATTGGSTTGSTGRTEVTETILDDGRHAVNVAASDRPAACSADGSPYVYGASSTTPGTAEPGGKPTGDGLHASPEDAKRYAKAHLKDYAWDDDQFEPLDRLWTRESAWQWDAENPDSGAYGIPQSLPADKMAMFGDDWRENAYTQIDWGLYYIADRYGSPAKAWEYSQETGWY